MRRLRQVLAGALLLTASLLGELPVAAAAEPPLAMTNLQVVGGEENWHPEEDFRLHWEQVPGLPAVPSAVVYRLYAPEGSPLGPPVTVTDNVRSLKGVEVPLAPGAYTIEAWLLNGEGEAGPASTAVLRFDNAPPSPPSPQAPSRWLLGTAQAVLEIDAPPLPQPLSGIRGYAVSVDRDGSSHPCQSLSRCTDEELDLWAGSGHDSVSLGTLPEGTNFARVVAVSGAGISSGVATAAFEVDASPPELSLQGAPSGWSDRSVLVTAQAWDALSGMAATGPDGPFTAISVDGAAPTLAWGGQAGAWVTGSGVHDVELFARDAAGNVAGGGGEAPSSTSAVVRIDEDAPRVSFASTQDPGEPERIEATVVDSLSGPSPDRGAIALRPAGTHAPYRELPTSVVGNKLIARWDSDAFPHGKYEFLATGFDAAGNPGIGVARAQGARMVLVNPVKAQALLGSSLAGRHLSGRLQRLGGAPIAGQEIVVTETLAPGSQPRQRAVAVRTAADGTFSLRLPPGPSRDVVTGFGGNRVLTRAAGPVERLDAHTDVRLRASAAVAKIGGRPVVFDGSVGALGARRAVRGLPVELQFRYPGAGWREFRTVEADRRGRFRYAYRFSDDDSRGIRFRFRAYVKGREGWPYEPSTSRPVLISGR